ncbi:hypothetical protein GCM10010222_02580 [Streptomyces tanashiensis]|nr:hypothetical protein GCM10010222_02580 [Streptomyces tanashiensis]GGY02113.1 hypothetical protein GCM10010299_00960 [Streptomyces tanashiensis]
MAGNKRGSACVRVQKSAGTALFDRTPDHVLLTYTQNVRFRFEPYVNLSGEGCPEE